MSGSTFSSSIFSRRRADLSPSRGPASALPAPVYDKAFLITFPACHLGMKLAAARHASQQITPEQPPPMTKHPGTERHPNPPQASPKRASGRRATLFGNFPGNTPSISSHKLPTVASPTPPVPCLSPSTTHPQSPHGPRPKPLRVSLADSHTEPVSHKDSCCCSSCLRLVSTVRTSASNSTQLSSNNGPLITRLAMSSLGSLCWPETREDSSVRQRRARGDRSRVNGSRQPDEDGLAGLADGKTANPNGTYWCGTSI